MSRKRTYFTAIDKAPAHVAKDKPPIGSTVFTNFKDWSDPACKVCGKIVTGIRAEQPEPIHKNCE